MMASVAYPSVRDSLKMVRRWREGVELPACQPSLVVGAIVHHHNLMLHTGVTWCCERGIKGGLPSWMVVNYGCKLHSVPPPPRVVVSSPQNDPLSVLFAVPLNFILENRRSILGI